MERLINLIYKLRIFSWLIAFFIGGFFYSLTCKANSLPNIDTTTFTVINGFNETLVDIGFLPQNVVPSTSITDTGWSPWNIGLFGITAVDDSDCNITKLSDTEKSYLLNHFGVIDSDNQLYSGNIYHVNYDNGFFSGDCYIGDDGKLLAYSDNIIGNFLQAKYGGNIKSYEDWEEMYQETALDIYSDQFLLTDHPEYITDVSYYLFEGTLSYGNPSSAYDLFIPNQYNKGVIVPVETTNGNFIRQWYFNSNDAYIYHTRYGTVNPLTVETGTFSKDNVSYTHRLTLNRIWYGNTANNDFFDWLNGINKTNCVFGAQGLNYNSSIGNSNAVSFKPLQYPEGSTVINYNTYYNYNDIQELEQRLNELQNNLNEEFDYNNPISESNYPFYYPMNNPSASPSTLPFPNNNPNPNPFPDSDPLINPTIENPYPDLDPTELNNSIPIISGLQNKFPFSIPWDIYNLIKGLSVPREIPVLEFSITFPIINYTWEPVIDLTMYDSTASLFRTLFLIIFIIGLAVFSYNHFFGT